MQPPPAASIFSAYLLYSRIDTSAIPAKPSFDHNTLHVQNGINKRLYQVADRPLLDRSVIQNVYQTMNHQQWQYYNCTIAVDYSILFILSGSRRACRKMIREFPLLLVIYRWTNSNHRYFAEWRANGRAPCIVAAADATLLLLYYRIRLSVPPTVLTRQTLENMPSELYVCGTADSQSLAKNKHTKRESELGWDCLSSSA